MNQSPPEPITACGLAEALSRKRHHILQMIQPVALLIGGTSDEVYQRVRDVLKVV